MTAPIDPRPTPAHQPSWTRNHHLYHQELAGKGWAVLLLNPQSGAVLNDDSSLAPLLRVVELGMDVHRSSGASRVVLGVVGSGKVDPRRVELLKQWDGTTTADRDDWNRIIEQGTRDGWYKLFYGNVAAVAPAVVSGEPRCT